MERLRSELSQEQQKSLMLAGAAVLATGTLYYLKKKLLGTSKCKEIETLPESVPEVTLPAIVSDVDGVVLRGKEAVEGSKEMVVKLLSPHKDTGRSIPFTFLTNNGGCFESTKADQMNTYLGLKPSFLGKMLSLGRSSGPKVTSNEMVMCQTVLRSEHF